MDNFGTACLSIISLGLMTQTAWLFTTTSPLSHNGERGDVPGWVLITLMTAGLVVVIWSAAGPALSGVFEQAITRVTGF